MTTAAFWIARCPQFIEEARQSALSFARHNEYAERYLITPDDIIAPAIFTDCFVVPYKNDEPWFLNCMRYYTRIFGFVPSADSYYLFDTDTRICANLDELEPLLQRFDFLGCHAPARHTTGSVFNLTDAFPEINIGFIAFKNNERAQLLFTVALENFIRSQHIYHNNDQGPLRDALWELSPDRIGLYILPHEFNFRFGFGGRVRSLVRVLHGRDPDLASVERVINANPNDFRVYKNGVLK